MRLSVKKFRLRLIVTAVIRGLIFIVIGVFLLRELMHDDKFNIETYTITDTYNSIYEVVKSQQLTSLDGKRLYVITLNEWGKDESKYVTLTTDKRVELSSLIEVAVNKTTLFTKSNNSFIAEKWEYVTYYGSTVIDDDFDSSLAYYKSIFRFGLGFVYVICFILMLIAYILISKKRIDTRSMEYNLRIESKVQSEVNENDL